MLREFENLLQRTRIFMERTIGVGPIDADKALNYGFTGPNVRAAGVEQPGELIAFALDALPGQANR